MTDTITLTGLVATDPRHLITTEGLAITNFRLASTQRRFDKKEGKWVDGDTNWYTITAFRQLALNVAACAKKGERVIVTGKLKLRSWDNGERAGMNVDVEADAVGHDLAWGTATFSRTLLSSSAPQADPSVVEEAGHPAPDAPTRDSALDSESIDGVRGGFASADETADDRDATSVPF
jgi:single-strand DNA-binding protein